MTQIYTHSQVFHPDEILAIALLEKFFLKEKFEIIRTRNETVLKKAKTDATVFVIDVGFEYDSTMLNFDHHQGNLVETWEDGTPFSACGLTWLWLRKNNHLTDLSNENLDHFEESFIQMADKLDNGLSDWPPGEILSAYNRKGDINESQFQKAIEVAHDLIENSLYQCQIEIEAKIKISSALENNFNIECGILNLEKGGGPFYARLAYELSDNKVNILVVPRTINQWLLITAPKNLEDPFSQKCPAPLAWRGKENFTIELDGISIPIIFCHKNGFMSIVKGTQEMANKVAFEIVKENQLVSRKKPSFP